MINLTDHSCSKCQHLNRYDRTRHGFLTQEYQKVQALMEGDIAKNNYRMTSYYRRQLNRLMDSIIDVENGHQTHNYLKR